MPLGKPSTEGMTHLCKQCGYVGQPKHAETHGSYDALGGTGLSTRTTVECANCGYWNWHVSPSGPDAKAASWEAGRRAERRAGQRASYFNDRRKA